MGDIKVIFNNSHTLTLNYFFGHIWAKKHDFLFETEPNCQNLVTTPTQTRVLDCTEQLQYRDFRCTVTVIVNPNSQKLQLDTVPE